jgi:insertion element IS1 protein InsB
MQNASPPQDPIPVCPRCRAGHVVRNGANRSGTPGFLCRACGRRFVAAPKKGPVPDDTKDLIRRLLGERMSLRGIARVTGVSRSWLQTFVNALLRDETPHHPGPLQKRPAGW